MYSFFKGLYMQNKTTLFILLFVILTIELNGQNFWSVTTLNEPSPGYLKIDIGNNGFFGLVDNYGVIRHIDSTARLRNGSVWKMLRNGNWSCYRDSAFWIFTENLTFVDSVRPPVGWSFDFHDMEVLDNGHYILLGLEKRVMDLSGIVDGGKSNANVEGVVLLEVDGNRNLYWSWNSFEHFSILDVTSDIDLTQPNIDFTHANAIDVDLDGNLLLSCRHLDEITKINKTTGQILWRWGGNECKNNEFGFINDTINGFFGFSHQHAIKVLPDGNYLLYDNGNLKPHQYSRAVEYSMNVSSKTVTKIWEYSHIPEIFSENSGNAQRLMNGNTLINWGENKITEVGVDGTVNLEFSLMEFLALYRVYKHVTKMNVFSQNISGNGLYDFNGSGDKEKTKVKINISSYTGTGKLTVERHDYAPPESSFSGADFNILAPYRWVIRKSGLNQIVGTIAIKISELNGIDNPSNLKIYKRDKETTGSFTELNTTYNSGTGELSANFSGFGEVILGSVVLGRVNLTYPSNNKIGVLINDTLRWSKVTGANSYIVQVSDDSTFSNKVINTTTSDIDKLGFNNFNYNKRYYWRVKAKNSTDTSDWSAVFNFITELSPPILNTPKNNQYGVYVNSIFTWGSVAGATGYKIEIANDSSFNYIVYFNKECLDNRDTVELNKFNKVHYYRVAAFRETDTSRWSEKYKFTTEMMIPNLTEPADSGINLDKKCWFAWDFVPGATSYQIQIGKDSLFKVIVLRKDSLTDNVLNYDSLKYNTEYYWHVRAVRTTDTSRWSSTRSFTTLLEPTKLVSPFNNSQGIKMNALFTWSYSSGAEYYHLQFAFKDDFKNVWLEKDSIYNNEQLVKDLPLDTLIYWRVKAKAGLKQSDWSEIWRFRTTDEMNNKLVELLEPVDYGKKINVNGRLQWSGDASIQSYYLKVSDRFDFSDCIFDLSGIQDEYFDYQNLNYNTVYYWKVGAEISQDSVYWTDANQFITELESPALISPADLSFGQEITGKLSWEEVNGANYYMVNLSKDSSYIELIVNEQVDSNEIFYQLDDSTTYYWKVKALNDSNESKWSKSFRFDTRKIISVTDFDFSGMIKIYPNPVKNSLRLELINNMEQINIPSEYFKILIVNVLGEIKKELIFRKNSLESKILNIDFNDLSDGNYMLIIDDLKYIKTIKIIKE
jgi:hypothetical protein